MNFNNLLTPNTKKYKEKKRNNSSPQELAILDLLRVLPSHNEPDIKISDIEERLKILGINRNTRALQRSVSALKKII